MLLKIFTKTNNAKFSLKKEKIQKYETSKAVNQK